MTKGHIQLREVIKKKNVCQGKNAQFFPWH